MSDVEYERLRYESKANSAEVARLKRRIAKLRGWARFAAENPSRSGEAHARDAEAALAADSRAARKAGR